MRSVRWVLPLVFLSAAVSAALGVWCALLGARAYAPAALTACDGRQTGRTVRVRRGAKGAHEPEYEQAYHSNEQRSNQNLFQHFCSFPYYPHKSHLWFVLIV